MAHRELLRQIPKMDELVARQGLVEKASISELTRAAREVTQRLRADILSGECAELPSAEAIENMVLAQITRENTPNLRRVINATGVILHTNLGRAPLAPQATQAVLAAASGYSTLEYDAELGARGSRHSHVDRLLTRITGAEGALVVNNNAAAVMLMLAALTKGRDVIVSRGELVEIGGSFRIPEVMEQSGCTLREVGATNRTRASDYENAISENTGALLKAHTSNYKIMGFTGEVSARELAELGAKHALPFLYDLGSGPLLPLAPFGVTDEPCVAECVAAGADVICFSGDKLLGGPQAGIIVGKGEYIAKMKKHPLARALRIDKLTLAALEATLRLYSDPEQALAQIPTLRMLSADQQTLRESAERLASLLASAGGQISVIEDAGQIGGGSAPTQLLPGTVVAITPSEVSLTELERRLRLCQPAIVARIAKERLLIDPRTIDQADFEYLAGRVLVALEREAKL